MDLDVVLLSRIQFAFVITFHIIFPAFTIGLAAWLATIEGMSLATGNPVYRRVFDFWLRASRSRSDGGRLGHRHGVPVRHQLERAGREDRLDPGASARLRGVHRVSAGSTFFGVMLLGRNRVPPWLYLLACCMVTLGTMASSFWILANNSWMQVPVGHEIVDGEIIPRTGARSCSGR